MLRLDEKVALVTGCGSIYPGWGNGKAIAVVLARQGASVFGIDRNAESAAETESVIREEGGTMQVHSADVTAADEVQAAVEACMSHFGRIDILVNNVGQSEPGGPEELDEDTWDAQFDINMKSTYLMCKHVLPVMVRQGGGSIVNVSSVAGLRYVGKPQVAYASAKAALMQFTRTTAVMYASKGIRLNCVVPGLVHTPLVKRLADKYAAGDQEGFIQHRHNQVPMQRMGDAWDIANATLFLASTESKYITAQELVVDGGLIAATK